MIENFPKKICCLIDSLNSGGAQRQMTWLIRALTHGGHQVRLLTYHQYNHYLPVVRECGVEPENIDSSTKVGRFWKFRKAVRKERPDVIISFLDIPNLLGLFSAMPPDRIPLIVSERSHDLDGKTFKTAIRFNAFRLATKVVTNCYSQEEFVASCYPFLKNRLKTILNCVDLDRFGKVEIPDSSILKIIVGASICERKNPMGLIKASNDLEARGIQHQIDWFGNNFFEFGNPTSQSAHFLACKKELLESKNRSFRFHAPIRDIEKLFRDYSACCLPSFREGCPNIICEAMSSGLPILASEHGDMKRMVGRSLGGVLFDAHDSKSIAEAIGQLSELSVEELRRIGSRNRSYAEGWLSPRRFAKEYGNLVSEVVS